MSRRKEVKINPEDIINISSVGGGTIEIEKEMYERLSEAIERLKVTRMDRKTAKQLGISVTLLKSIIYTMQLRKSQREN